MPLKRLINLNGTERTDNSKTTAKQKRQAARQLNLKQPIPRQQTTKAVTYNEWPKIKRDTRQKNSPFTKKKTAFLLGISLHFRPSVIHYGFRQQTPRQKTPIQLTPRQQLSS